MPVSVADSMLENERIESIRMTCMCWSHPHFTLYVLSNKDHSRSHSFLRPLCCTDMEAEPICDLKQKIDARHDGTHL